MFIYLLYVYYLLIWILLFESGRKKTCHHFCFLPRNKECPTCRKKLVSRRSLRRDSNFDALISKIYPSRDEYEAHQRRVLERLNRLHNKDALSSSIEEGLRQQSRYRSERWGTKRGSQCVLKLKCRDVKTFL